jgi:DNA-binding NarL/FixJ family response regulator
MVILEFIEATNAARSGADVFALFSGAIGAHGYDRIFYGPWDSAGGKGCFALESTYPAEWLDHYIGNAYAAIDPVRRLGRAGPRPFYWHDIPGDKLNARERRLLAEGREAGLRDGIGIGLHDPIHLTGLGLASSTGGADADRATLSLLHLLAIQFHLAYQSTQPADPAPVALTRREREILSWCAQGKTNWVIGEILHISEHGVDFHVRNILRKLDADCRTTAVVKALRLRLIEP